MSRYPHSWLERHSRPFPSLLSQLLKRRGLSIRRFAVLTQQNATFVSQILREQRRPPLHRMEQWADVLRIYGQAREDFLNAAALAHAPQRVVDLLARSGLDFPGLEQLLVCDERNEGTP